MSSRKRPLNLEELDHLDAVEKPIANASVHGAITSLSPVKKGRNTNYFDGTIADERTKLRLVGFSSDQQRKLSSFFKNGTTINLQNCQVKESREGNKMEVMLKGNTIIVESEKDINKSLLDCEDVNTPAFITLSQLLTTQNFQRVSMNVKVIELKTPTYVTGEKMKQDVIIADSTGNAKLTLWEKDVNSLDLVQSYSLCNFTVREYHSKKYLSMPKEGYEIRKISDIGTVNEDPLDESEREVMELHNAQIIGVPQLDSYKSCLTCKARVDPESPPLGRCTKCDMLQRYDMCVEQMSAKILFMKKFPGDPQSTIKPLHAFGRIVQDLAGVPHSEVTREALLTSKPVTVTYNSKQVITSLLRK